MLTAILFATAASNVPIDVGRFNQAEFPNAKTVERRIPHAELTHRIDTILGNGRCEIPGQVKTSYDITVPYAALIQPSGEVTRVVVKEIGCAPIETLVGQFAIELSKAGGFRPTHEEGERWYVSEVNFYRASQRVATATDAEGRNKVVCRAAEPVAGSRIAKKKVCRTVAEWELYETDRAQFQRDLQHRGLDPATE